MVITLIEKSAQYMIIAEPIKVENKQEKKIDNEVEVETNIKQDA